MDRAQHDELAELFAQNMQLTPQGAPSQEPTNLRPVVQRSEKQPDPPIHFISSHYTHTGHIRPDTVSEPSRSPPPSYHEAIMPEALANVLRQHSIDPSALLPNQIHLFINADYDQRLRLLELWRIAPPSYPLEERRYAHLTATNLANEEAQAKLRYEQNMQARFAHPEEHMVDTYVPTSINTTQPFEIDPRQAEAEPYILHGYSDTHPPRSIDPVYAAAPNLWQAPNYALAQQKLQQRQQQRQYQQQSAMEDQYGMVEHIRNHADWERLNQRNARQNFAGLNGCHGTDDDMIM